MPEKTYSLLDLIRDDGFITWVRQPNSENKFFWERYLETFPAQKETIAMARNYVNIIAEDTGRDLPTMRQRDKMWKEVKQTIKSENSEN